MPKYEIKDKKTGKSIIIEGPQPPTPEQAEQIILNYRNESGFTQSQVDKQIGVQAAKMAGVPEPLVGLGELALEAGTGLAGMVESGYKTAFNLFSGEDFSEQGVKVAQNLEDRTYEPVSKEAEKVRGFLGDIGGIAKEAAMYAPASLYASLGMAKNLFTGEELEAAEAQFEMDREAFSSDPNTTLGEDVLTATGSPMLAATTDAGLLGMQMMIGGASPNSVRQLNRGRNQRKVEDLRKKQIARELDPLEKVDPTQRIYQFDPNTKELETITPWQIVNEEKFTPAQIADFKGFVGKSPAASKARDQGFDDRTIALFGGLSPSDANAAAKMLRIVKESRADALVAGKSRVSDVVGNGVVERYRFIKAQQKKAGRNLNKIVESEASTPVSFDKAINSFQKDLNGLGVSLDLNDGIKIDFTNSALGESEPAMKMITKLVERMASKGGQNLKQGHLLKKFIDETMSLNNIKEGLTGNSQVAIAKLRKNINQAIKNESPKYKAVNETYSETTEVINNLQKAVGPSVKLDSESSRKALGTAFRRMLSNAQSRQAQLDVVALMDKVAGKHGATFKDSIYNQMVVASQLEEMFDLAPKNSLQGQSKSAVSNAMIELAVDTQNPAIAGLGWLNKLTQTKKKTSQEDAIKTIDALIKENQKN